MKLTFILTKLFLAQLISFHEFFENLKAGGKKTFKSLGIILIFAYCAIVFGGMYFFMVNIMYKGYSQIGLPSLVLITIGLSAFTLTLFFGFMTSINTYITGSSEEFLFAMPLKPSQIFIGKFLSTYVIEFIWGFAIIGLGAGIFGFYQGLLTNPLFYIVVLISAATIPLITLAFCYLLLVVLLNLFRKLRNKSLLVGINSVIMVGIILTFSFAYQSVAAKLEDPEFFETLINNGSLNSVLAIANFLPPVQWFARSMALLAEGKYLQSIGYAIILLSVAIIIPTIILPLLSPLYIRSLNGFNDVSTKKLQKGEEKAFIKSDIKATPLTKALFLRDVKSVLREPVWFVNGPIIIILMPIILLISAAAGLYGSLSDMGGISSLPQLITDLSSTINQWINTNPQYISTILYSTAGILSMIAVFSGTSTSISSTAISREGKGFSNLLAMPIPFEKLFKAKIMHAMLYTFITILFEIIAVLIVIALLQPAFSFTEIVQLLINIIWFTTSLSIIIHIMEFSIDISHPKLEWENPAAAFKQNLTATLSVFIIMGIVAVLVVAGIFIPIKTPIVITFVAAILTGIAVLSWRHFIKVAEKKLRARF